MEEEEEGAAFPMPLPAPILTGLDELTISSGTNRCPHFPSPFVPACAFLERCCPSGLVALRLGPRLPLGDDELARVPPAADLPPGGDDSSSEIERAPSTFVEPALVLAARYLALRVVDLGPCRLSWGGLCALSQACRGLEELGLRMAKWKETPVDVEARTARSAETWVAEGVGRVLLEHFFPGDIASSHIKCYV